MQTNLRPRRPAAPPSPGGDERAARRRAERRARWLWRIAGYVFFVGLWQFTSSFLVADFIVPPPAVILTEMWDIIASGQVWVHFGATLRTIAIGFAIAFVLGSATGLLMGRSRWWEAFLSDWVMATLTTPGLIFALVTAMIFGLGPTGPIVAVVVTSFSYVTVNVVEGVKAVPRDLTDMARSFGRGPAQILRHVYLPFLAPYFFTATRYGFSIAWKIATLAEVIVGTAGIGFMMRQQFQQFSMRGFLAWVLLFFAFALFLERVVLQRRMRHVLRWRPEVAR
ncbi:ABC transporter permease [Phytohabitans sp. ZYX-F-186]|uniref:ABC transporter permease n=1 Tax=Phytohabitans maris TaxID=3071409 RepID=A0ABU0ZTI4_9ACTN|nr:ABC transporter permease [Phytohabitans sp. ZYX-F-186]MDQ7910350.1 ABC transporter permease [Phytohabitans sp. ZYX-F-186]